MVKYSGCKFLCLDLLTKNADPVKYKYFGYGIGFDARGVFSLSDGNGFGKNAMIFGADMSSSVHIDKRKDILIHDKSTIEGLDDITLTAEKKCSINFTEQQMKFCLSLLYNGANSYIC